MSDLKNLKLTVNVPFSFALKMARQQTTQYGPSLMVITEQDECFWLPVDTANALIQAGATTRQTEKGLVYDGVRGKRFVAHKVQLAGEKHAVTQLYPEGTAGYIATGGNFAAALDAATKPAPASTVGDLNQRPAALQTPPEPMPWDGDAKEPPTFAESELVRKYDECLTWAIQRCAKHNTTDGVKLPMMGADAMACAATIYIQRMKAGL